MKRCRFINSLPLSYLHVFTYSERSGTPAENYPGKVPNRIRDERSHTLHLIGTALKKEFYSSQVNSRRTVIFEQKKPDGTMTGFTENYVEVVTELHPDFIHQPGRVLLRGPQKNGMVEAELISTFPLP
jgi:threonylcarbamoyladenosine tRNA methylthiotransferase MtaB